MSYMDELSFGHTMLSYAWSQTRCLLLQCICAPRNISSHTKPDFTTEPNLQSRSLTQVAKYYLLTYLPDQAAFFQTNFRASSRPIPIHHNPPRNHLSSKPALISTTRFQALLIILNMLALFSTMSMAYSKYTHRPAFTSYNKPGCNGEDQRFDYMHNVLENHCVKPLK